MTNHRVFPMTLVAVAVLAGCSSLPADNPQLVAARSDYAAAQSNPQTVALAPSELKQAGDALKQANDAWTRNDKLGEVDHLAYLAKQRVAIAQETGKQKSAELAVTDANKTRDEMRLAARTNEADAAQRSAESAQRNADASQRNADASQRQSEASRRQSEAAQRDSEASQRQSAASQQQARDAEMRSGQLEAQLKDLNAKKTERGLVITIGDVLFDTNKAQLKSGGMRSVEKLVGFMKQYPQRTAMVEGFTDSTGSDSTNQELSGRRANAVRMALVDLGVNSDRVAARGFGEAYPVASNASLDGRQLNRRVEIVLSDDKGNIAPR
jgi:outer membrane protein OmpA-like peptidoglycan-associated protein